MSAGTSSRGWLPLARCIDPRRPYKEIGSERGGAVRKSLVDGLRAYAHQHNIEIEGFPADPNAEVPPEHIVEVLQNSMAMFFPQLAKSAPSPAAPPAPERYSSEGR